jgi:hypothetical protein
MARTFTACYDSECNGCFCDIYEGDEIGWLDGEVVCESCLESEDD